MFDAQESVTYTPNFSQTLREQLQKVGRLRSKAHGSSKLTTKSVCVLLQLVAFGFSYRMACRKVGIPRGTFDKWMIRAKADRDSGIKSRYAEFLEALNWADAHGELALLSAIFHFGGASGAKWLLSRRNYFKYGNRDKVLKRLYVEVQNILRIAGRVLPEESFQIFHAEVMKLVRSWDDPSGTDYEGSEIALDCDSQRHR